MPTAYHTSIYFKCDIQGLDDDTLVVREFNGCESLSDTHYQEASQQTLSSCYGFRYEIGLASRRSNLSPENLIDKKVSLSVFHDGELSFCVNGIIRAFEQRNTGYKHTFYTLTLIPALERLSLRQNSRIFQYKTTEEIIRTLLSEMGIDDVRFNLAHEYQQREYCVQYRESDLDFIHRLAAEEGMVYHFSHSEGGHTLVLSDVPELRPALKEPVLYHSLGGGVSYQPFISEFNVRTQHSVTQTQLNDYSFKKPAYPLMYERRASDTQAHTIPYSHFDTPGRFQGEKKGRQFARVRQEFLQRESIVASGKSNDPRLRAGIRFTLEDDLNTTKQKQWTVIEVFHSGQQQQALEEEAGQAPTTYTNRIKAIPAKVNWQATPNLKPQIHGDLTAVVTGPEGEEIHTDEYGRVKVHFHWDRYSDFDDKSSCWLRVSQISAGNQFGVMLLPRVGSEVLVSFLNSDPDRPVITGQLYNAANVPPYSLPLNKTKTTLRTKTHQGDGFNELSFEDQAGHEQIYLRAQKDLHQDIHNDQFLEIKNEHHETIGSHYYKEVKQNHHLTVRGDSNHTTDGAVSVMAKGSLQQKTNSLAVIDAGNEIHIKAGEKVVIEAASELTLKAGGSFIKLDAAGVHLVGAAINQNSGGSAGSGSGFSGSAAESPTRIEGTRKLPAQVPSAQENTFPPLTPRLQDQVITDLKEGTPVTLVCQKAPDSSCPLTDCPCGAGHHPENK